MFGENKENYYFLCFFLFILEFPCVETTYPEQCSSNKQCTCTRLHDGYYKADCSRKDLTDIPLFDENVVVIDMSGNEKLTKIAGNIKLPILLKNLDINSCNLHYIELGALEKQKNLEYLDISWNKALTLNVLPNVTNDLSGSNIKILKFNAIQCPNGAGITLRYEHLCRLQKSSLKEIEMAKNRIDMVEQFTLRSLPKSLVKMSAGFNRLRFGPYFMEFSSLESIRYVNLSDMYAISSPFRDPWIMCDDSKDETVDEYLIPKGLLPCPEMNKIENTALLDNIVIMYMPPKLETMIRNNFIVYLPDKWNNLILKYNSLKRTVSRHNFLQFLRGTDYSGKLEEADFSYNFIREIDDLFFTTSNLTILDLSYNLLGHFFSTERSVRLLHRQQFLEILKLSNNKLNKIHYEMFEGLSRLQVLNLSDTELKNVRFTFRGLTQLSSLDLSNNRIRAFSDLNMHELDKLSEGIPLSINLTWNDFLCACETLEFLQWMQRKQAINSRITLTKFENYTCSFADSTKRSFRDISKIILDLKLKCSSKSTIFIISGFVIFAFIIIVISGILYRYRWKLRYIYYMTRRSLRGYFLLKDHDGRQTKCYEFDAFISFADEDATFAHRLLKSKVQSKYPSAKLCYHYEQFIAGTDVAENIVNAVNCSRRTICVLTDNFLASEWCIYEFKMANLEKIYRRGDQNSLIILMLGSIHADRVPADIMTFLKSRSYLEVPEDMDDSDVFWDTIISSVMEDG